MTILMLADVPKYSSNANTLFDHINAIQNFSKHKILVYPKRGDLPAWINLEQFDAVVIHYTLLLFGENYVSKKTKEQIKSFTGLKALFMQDEFQLIRPINQEIKRLGISLLFSCMREPVTLKLYPKEEVGDVAIETVLTGYVPQEAPLTVPRLADRPITVSYRGRKLPYWYGKFAKDKWEIVPKFQAAVAAFDDTRHWKTDLSYLEKDRIYGDRWTEFLAQSRVTLGVESGTSMVDFDGSLRRRAEEYVSKNPDATFEDVELNCFPGEDENLFIKAISPRCFEAIATKTAMVLYEGEYSGVLVPWLHYVPLKKDFSNFAEVAASINNLPLLETMVTKAYEDIILSGKYGPNKLAEAFDTSIGKELKRMSLTTRFHPWCRIKFQIGQSLDQHFERQISGYWKERFETYSRIGLHETCVYYFGLWTQKWSAVIKPVYKFLRKLPILSKTLKKIRNRLAQE